MSRRIKLSPSQQQIIQMICDGLMDKQISYQLSMEWRPLRKDIEELHRRSDTKTRTQLAVWAIRNKYAS